MIRNYLKIAWRNLIKNKVSFIINVGGLAIGIAVVILIGLWVWDELSFNKSFPNYNRIAQVLTNMDYNGGVNTDFNTAPPYGPELKRLYGKDFKYVLMTSNTMHMLLSSGEKSLKKTGYYFEPGIADMLSFKMLKGSRSGLEDPSSIMLSASVAYAFFGMDDPIGKTMKIENQQLVVVRGVYQDLPANTDFSDMGFVAPWQLYVAMSHWFLHDSWEQDGFQTFVQIADHADMNQVSRDIKNLKLNHVDKQAAKSHPQVFLLPMNKFHLYSDFDNGVVVGRSAHLVWMYALIGFFVLLLACINFMNLATARSEKRAKEVGILKAIGSYRMQLVQQYLMESLVVVVFSFALSVLIAQILLPVFNNVTGKSVEIPWSNPLFWLLGICLVLVTGLIAGSYPAFYLSSFTPVKVLKGLFRSGQSTSTPRRILVVTQFAVSIALIIGVVTVYRQIQLGKGRPVGYKKEGLMSVTISSGEIHDHFSAFRQDLISSGAAMEAAEMLNPVTMLGFASNGFEWKARGIDQNFWIGKAYITPEYGKTVGWQIVAGRDLSRDFASDSTGVVVNESMARYMGVANPLGMTIKESILGRSNTFHVIGVVKDMLMQSPYRPVKETVYIPDKEETHLIAVRINPLMPTTTALGKIESVFKRYAPASPFEFTFVKDQYAQKFSDEERSGTLACAFATLAILISCLGIFGMAAFMAEQRTKEIGIRKVLGASAFNLWQLLSRDFVSLVLVSLLIAAPVAYFLLHRWLQNFELRAGVPWWVYAVSGLGAMLLTIVTVSFQAIKAATASPIKSLRTE